MESNKVISSRPSEKSTGALKKRSWTGRVRTCLRMWAAAAIALSATLTGAAPAPFGYWNFDNAANREQLVSGSGTIAKNGTVAYVQGPNGTSDGAAQLSGATGWYTCTHGMSANGGSSAYVRNYTMMWDVKYPNASTWKCLLQTNAGNSNDGDLFIRNNTTGNIGAAAQLGGYSSNATAPNTWYRIVMTCNTTLASGDVKVYVNGALWYTSTKTTITSDGTYALDPAFLISKDDNGEDDTMVLSAFAVWNSTLSAADVTSLGTVANELVPKSNQTVTFSPVADKTYGDAPFDVSASASSGLGITYSVVSGPASVSGSTVTITGAGAVTLQAWQAGNATYNAVSTNQSFTVNKADQNVSFNPIADKIFGDAPFDVSASASSGLGVTFSVVSGPATVNNSTVTLTGVGVVTLQAAQTGNSNYNAAYASQSLAVAAANTAPTISALPDRTISKNSATEPISFTLGDAESPVSGLTVTGNSSNLLLVPNENIVFGGSAADRTVTVTPAAGQYGSAEITLTVSDGELSAQVSFTLTVNAADASQYRLTVESACGGVTPPAGTNMLAHGVPVVCQVTNSPVVSGDAQFICTGWSLTGGVPAVGTGTSFIVVPTNDMRLAWQWSTNYWLNVQVSGGGELSEAPSWHAAGGSVAVEAIGNSLWAFIGWIGDTEGCTIDGSHITVPLTRLRAPVTALFERTDLTLTIMPVPGNCEPVAGEHAYASGAAVTCSASDLTDGLTQYVCTGWTLQGAAPHAGTGRMFTTILTRSASLAWQYQTNYWLDTAVSGAGSISAAAGWQAAGVPVQLIATPAAGQRFDQWGGDTNGCVLGGDHLIVPMDHPRGPVTAIFVTAESATDSDFEVIALPDTQNYSTSYPATYNSQCQWVVDNKMSRNIQFVTHLGDLVNTATSASEWTKCAAAMDILTGQVPYNACRGNHDMGTYYTSNFGPGAARWKTGGNYCDWYKGASPSGNSSFQMITYGGRTYLFLNLDVDAPGSLTDTATDLGWAQAVINSHRGILTILSTHDLLAEVGSNSNTGSGTGARGPCIQAYVTGHSGKWIQDNFVFPNNEIFMVLCGHNFAQYNLAPLNNAGNPVHEIMIDYQTLPAGGNGFLRIMDFKPASKQIVSTTWSTTLNRFMTRPANSTDSQGMLELTDPSGSAFTLSFDFDHRFDGTLTVVSAEGPVSPTAGAHVYAPGTAVLCSAPDVTGDQTRRRATGWTLSGSQSGSGSGNSASVTMNGNAQLTWQWASDYWLETAEVGDGQVSVVSGWQPSGTVVALQALPDAGATFLGWSGDTNGCQVIGSALSVTMDRARGPITAQFSSPSTTPVYTLTVASSETGVNPTPGSYLYTSGSVVNCSAALTTLGGTQTVCTGWALSDGTSGEGSSVAVSLHGDRTVSWSWKRRYELVTAALGPGTVTPSAWLDAGSTVTLTALPEEQSAFIGWEGDLEGLAPSGTSLTLTVDRARGPVTARFAINSHTVSIISAYGVASPSGTVSIAHGSVVTNEVADEVAGGWRYVCTGWRMEGLETTGGGSNRVVYTCTNNAALTWLWETQVLVRVASQGKGVITPMDVSGWHLYGTELTLQAHPSRWYRFDRWAQDANGQSPSVSVALTGPRTVEARFAPETTLSGAPVWWMEQRGLTAGGRTSAEAEMIDTDGDGISDAEEYVSGTSPDDPASVLAITDVKFGSDNRLGWRSVSGRVYDVLCSTNLAQGFVTVLTDIQGQNGRTEVELPVVGTGGSCFWRVSVRAPAVVEEPPVSSDALPIASSAVPAGGYVMGDDASSLAVEKPAHAVTLAAFTIDRFEVTRGDWRSVAVWANAHGYDLPPAPQIEGQPRPDIHPVTPVSWHEAVKWCNARSEMEGRTACYYTDMEGQSVYRTGQVDLVAANVNWSGDGYRLPTEAEWEYAARGGLAAAQYPWGDAHPDQRANQWEYWVRELDVYPGDYPWTTPVGTFNGNQAVAAGHQPAPDTANGFGLYDMAGNVMEWCWDRRGAYRAQADVDPRGSDTGEERAVRGGSWWNEDVNSRCAFRYWYGTDGDPVYGSIGFRCVRRTP